MSDLSPRQRVERALRGGHSDRVPFAMYENKIPQTASERRMRNRGLCIVQRMPVFKIHRPNVRMTQQVYWEADKQLIRTVWGTPRGELSTLVEPKGYTSWVHEKMFKTPDDYKAMLFLIQDECYEQNYRDFARAQEACGEDFFFMASFGLEPLQELISGELMDMQDFCIQWMDNQDEILKLYEAIIQNKRKLYPIVSESPALAGNYGGNVVVEVIGLESFKKYYVQHYNEAAEEMHKRGKLVGCHFDGNCRQLAETIAGTDLDYIEAFTPAPDTDMTLAQDRRAWPDKVLWLNFPSSLHLRPDSEITAATLSLLDEAVSADGVIMGITEDMPEDRWQNSCPAIMDGLEEHARLHPELYG